jgi:hypothetical protein
MAAPVRIIEEPIVTVQLLNEIRFYCNSCGKKNGCANYATAGALKSCDKVREAETCLRERAGCAMTILVGHAEFDQLGNDLFWTYYCEGERVSWSGYNDAHWWNKISKSEQTTTRTLKSGKKLQIDFRTTEIFEVP